MHQYKWYSWEHKRYSWAKTEVLWARRPGLQIVISILLWIYTVRRFGMIVSMAAPTMPSAIHVRHQLAIGVDLSRYMTSRTEKNILPYSANLPIATQPFCRQISTKNNSAPYTRYNWSIGCTQLLLDESSHQALARSRPMALERRQRLWWRGRRMLDLLGAVRGLLDMMHRVRCLGTIVRWVRPRFLAPSILSHCAIAVWWE